MESWGCVFLLAITQKEFVPRLLLCDKNVTLLKRIGFKQTKKDVRKNTNIANIQIYIQK